MSERPPDRLMSPDGTTGWFARARGSRERQVELGSEILPDGSVIRVMGDYGVTVPLWSAEGLMFGESAELVNGLGVSTELAANLEAWASAWEKHGSEPAHDARAAALVRRLRAETAGRFQVVYHP